MGRPDLTTPAGKYLLAVGLTGAAVLARGLIDPWLGDRQPFATLYVALPLAVWIAGSRPAILAAAIGYLAADWWFLEPRGAFGIAALHQLATLGTYLVFSAVVIGLGQRLRQAAGRVRASEQRARDVLESITDGLMILDRHWRFTYVNRQAERLLREPGSNLTGRSFWDVFPWSVGTELERQIRHAAAEQVPCHLESYDPRSGRWHENRAHPTPDGGIAIYFHDITDRKHAEERLAAVLASIDDLLVCYDREWRFTYVNEPAAQLLGRPPDALIGRTVWDLFPEMVGNQYYLEVHDAVRERRVVRSEHYYAPFGRWFENHIYPTAEGVTVFSADVTDRKRADEVQGLLAAVVESSEDAIVSKTLDGTITSWNAGAQRLFGYTADEAIGQSITMLIPRDRQQEEQLILDRVARGDRVESYETVRVSRDGRLVDISLSISPLHDATGRIVGASKVARDVSARRRAEESARSAQSLLRLITDNVPALISYIDRDRRYRLNNRAYETWFGQRRSAIVGQHVSDVLGAEASARLQPHMDAALAGETVTFEDEIPYRDGGSRWISGTYVPHVDANGTVMGFAVLVNDITARRRAEEDLRRLNKQLWEADRRKDEFLAILAHELRNPLAPIRNAVEILRIAEPSDRDLRAMRDIIDRQVKQMTRLVDDLLEVSRISGGRVQLRRERLSLGDAVRDAVEAARPLIQSAGHEITVTEAPQPLELDADPTRVTQVILNLLNNAAKYTPSGGHIWLTVERQADMAVLSVRDTGVGIPAAHLPHLFEMFSQVAPALEGAQGGLGIGLALVKGLVDLHGGSVEAHSAGPGLGSEFIVRLPLAEAPAAGDAGMTVVPAFGEAVPSCRVLVVDDNRDAAESLGIILDLSGHDVRIAHDGLEAVQAAASFRPDVILLDIGLPKMNGYEAARAIRHQPWGQDVALVALTGWGQEEDKRRAAEAGFNRHLTKPVDPVTLEAVLQDVARESEHR